MWRDSDALARRMYYVLLRYPSLVHLLPQFDLSWTRGNLDTYVLSATAVIVYHFAHHECSSLTNNSLISGTSCHPRVETWNYSLYALEPVRHPSFCQTQIPHPGECGRPDYCSQ